MLADLHELFRSRELLLSWTMREFRVRYSQSVLGITWAILQPLSLMVISSLVFSIFLQVPTQGVPYPVFSYSALLPWTFFANAMSTAIPSLVSNFNLVSKIYFPREILPIASILVNLVDFFIAAIIFIGMLIFYHIEISPALLALPLILIIQIFFTVGLTLAASALNVFYRDIRFVIPLLLQLWIYLSPVFYPLETVPERFRSLYLLNPMATLIDSYRRVTLLRQFPRWDYLAIAALISLIVCIFGYRYFKHAEKSFADLI